VLARTGTAGDGDGPGEDERTTPNGRASYLGFNSRARTYQLAR
jgi:hypothetical protein